MDEMAESIDEVRGRLRTPALLSTLGGDCVGESDGEAFDAAVASLDPAILWRPPLVLGSFILTPCSALHLLYWPKRSWSLRALADSGLDNNQRPKSKASSCGLRVFSTANNPENEIEWQGSKW